MDRFWESRISKSLSVRPRTCVPRDINLLVQQHFYTRCGILRVSAKGHGVGWGCCCRSNKYLRTMFSAPEKEQWFWRLDEANPGVKCVKWMGRGAFFFSGFKCSWSECPLMAHWWLLLSTCIGSLCFFVLFTGGF